MTAPSAAPSAPPWNDGSFAKATTVRPLILPVADTAPMPSTWLAT